MATPKSLLACCLDTVASNINIYKSLEGLPEELVVIVFESVLKQGRLNPHNLKLFKDTDYPWLLQHIKALNIRDTPARVASTDHAWLGDRPSYY